MVPVFLILFSILLLGIAAGAALILLSIFLAVRRGREGRALTISLFLLALLLAVRFGGGLVLALLGLSWRRRVQGILFLSAGVIFLMAVHFVNKEVKAQSETVPWIRRAIPLCSVLSVLGLVVMGGVCVLFRTWSDRVVEGNEWTDQRAVVECTGIFRETGYRYVNFLVKGEQIYEWED